MNIKKYCLAFAVTPLAAALLLTGCTGSAGKDKPQAAATAAPAPQAAANPADATAGGQTRPGRMAGEVIEIDATVKAVDKKNRIVTLLYPDGHKEKIKCGPEVRNFNQIRVGDEVSAQFIETVELFVTGADEPGAERTSEIDRAPLGSKPGFAAFDAVEIKASVVAINYQTREVTLRYPEGKLAKITAGPEVQRLNEVKQGDTVVARVVRSISIEVSKPVK